MVTPRFSFKYNGIPFDELEKTSEISEKGILYTLPDGLKLECRIERFPKYNVVKWTNYWYNDTDHNSGIVTDLWDCDTVVEFDPDPVKTRRNKHSVWTTDTLQLYITDGANITDYDNMARATRLWPNESLKAANHSGRSGMGTSPFFDLNRRERGYLIAVGWTGQWNAQFERGEKDVRVLTRIENVKFYMKPGEKFRTSSVTVLEYENGQDNAHNAWRRYIKEYVSPVGKQERDKECPFSAIFWGGIPTDGLKRRWEGILKEKLPFDYCWMDAGWYEPLCGVTCAEQSAEWGKVGIWEVNRGYHPGGLKDAIAWLRERGIKYQLWFEPERINLVNEPWTEYMLPLHNMEDKNVIIALHKDEVADQLIEKISKMIEELGITIYRQDFNIGPIPFWRLNDEKDRDGVNEIKYLNNLYRFWDTLLERFPYLLIDNCAGGGHRVDIESLARAVPLWRSDFYCIWDNVPEGFQIQEMGNAWWYPYSGVGYGPTLGDTYSFRSAYAPGMTVRTWEHADPEWEVGAMGEPFEWARKYFNEYLSVRHYFSCDYYPLIRNSRETISWAAYQYDEPETDSGIILAFRREECPFDSADFFIGGVKADKTYEFVDADTGERTVIKGDELIKNGMRLNIPNKRQSLLIRYKQY